MRVLITWGSRRGGTEGLARMLGAALRAEGFDVELCPAREARAVVGLDAVIVGGALYANRWHRDARRFVARHERALRTVPVWLFSSGPLDDSAAREVIPPPPQVERLAERIGAQGHMTFGGRLASDAHGFPAAAMARQHAGDWRDPEAIRGWAGAIARALPSARPRPVVAQPGRSATRVVVHGVVGWAASSAAFAGLLRIASPGLTLALHAVLAVAIFAAVAHHYFQARGAWDPLPVASAFVVIAAVLDLIGIAGLARRDLAMFASLATWLPLALCFAVTFAIGQVKSMIPIHRPAHPGPTA